MAIRSSQTCPTIQVMHDWMSSIEFRWMLRFCSNFFWTK